MPFKLESRQLVHVMSEVVVMFSMIFYFSSKISNLNKKILLQDSKIDDLEKIIQEHHKLIKKIQSNQASPQTVPSHPSRPPPPRRSALEDRQEQFIQQVNQFEIIEPNQDLVEMDNSSIYSSEEEGEVDEVESKIELDVANAEELDKELEQELSELNDLKDVMNSEKTRSSRSTRSNRSTRSARSTKSNIE